MREFSSCSCLTALPGPAWVLLSKTFKPFRPTQYSSERLHRFEQQNKNILYEVREMCYNLQPTFSFSRMSFKQNSESKYLRRPRPSPSGRLSCHVEDRRPGHRPPQVTQMRERERERERAASERGREGGDQRAKINFHQSTFE